MSKRMRIARKEKEQKKHHKNEKTFYKINLRMSLCYNIAEAVCKGGKNGLDCSSHTGGCTNGLLLIGRKGSNIISGFSFLIIAFNR